MQTSPVNPAMCRVPQRAGAGAHCETAAGLSAADLDGYLAVPLMGALQARSRGTDVARSLLAQAAPDASWCRVTNAGDKGHMGARPEVSRYNVRVEIPHISGTNEWSASAKALQQGLAEQPSLLVAERHIEFVTRQRRDYVRISATVEAAHLAEAAVIMWAVLLQAIGEDVPGWDMAAASAEIRPARPAH